MINAAVAAALEAHTGPIDSSASAGGGCINDSLRVTGRDGRRWFLKLNEASQADMFAAEAAGLEELAAARAVRVPGPVAQGIADHQAYLLMEHLELSRAGGSSAAELGRQLARQHRVTREQFGWHRDNTIGSTPQPNEQCDDWLSFWRDRRLGFQLQLAVRNGYGRIVDDLGTQLLDALPRLFGDHEPEASLLHGDLWGGNWGAMPDGQPVIFDPAVYFGDREADLAMTRLFGGFPSQFYTAYEQEWPLPPGADIRVDLYNLYHILNHLNLFGGGYATQAQGMLKRLLAI
ncbi:MAG: fructosamine kinase family protein [Gammaproteobacteria bacterium]|nr:fructosamine kinase family protein [Gammaproteobacteria bacterium]